MQNLRDAQKEAIKIDDAMLLCGMKCNSRSHPPIEKELGDDKINKNLPMASSFQAFDSFAFGVSNVFPAIDVDPVNLIDQQHQERIHGEEIQGIPHLDEQVKIEDNSSFGT